MGKKLLMYNSMNKEILSLSRLSATYIPILSKNIQHVHVNAQNVRNAGTVSKNYTKSTAKHLPRI